MPKGKADRPREVLRLEHTLTLKDIPPPGICSECGSALQKEFLEWREDYAWLVITASPVPGYGCTGCGSKEHVPSLGLRFMEEAAERFVSAGFKEKAKQLRAQNSRMRKALDTNVA